MRQRIERRLQKAVRIANEAEPGLLQHCAKRHRLADALVGLVRDRTAPVGQRYIAAQLISLYQPDPFRPLLEQFLASDVESDWYPVYLGNLRLTTDDQRQIVDIIQRDPNEHKRMAALDILTNHGRPGTHRIVISVLEDQAQSLLVRGRAVESFNMDRGKREVLDALRRALSDPEPSIRFWAVYALGQIAQFRFHLHSLAIAALQPLLNDHAEVPEYWTVGREAQALLEDMIPEQAERGKRERAEIFADPNSPVSLRRWAEWYDHDFQPPSERRYKPRLKVRYRNFTWYRSL